MCQLHHWKTKDFGLSRRDLERSTVLPMLVLVGGEHGDPSGYRRTKAFLLEYRPDLILIELSPFGLHLRLKRSSLWLQTMRNHLAEVCKDLNRTLPEVWCHPAVMKIRHQLGLPFEYRAAIRHARSHSSKLQLCDASAFSRQFMASWPELICRENLYRLLYFSDSAKSYQDGYMMARRALGEEDRGESLWIGVVEKQWGSWWNRREQHLARSVWTALHALKPGRPVYLGGWQHLLHSRDHVTLRTLLGIGRDRCVLLPDARTRFAADGMDPCQSR